MAKRTREIDGVQRRYSWRLYPTKEQGEILRHQAVMMVDLWNALLEICQTLQQVRVWVFDKSAGGPLLFDLNGNMHPLKLSDVLLRRRILRGLHINEVVRCRDGGIDCDPIVPRLAGTTAREGNRDREVRSWLPSEFDMGYWISSLLAADPEWRTLSTWTPRRVVESLINAYKAYWSFLKDKARGKPVLRDVGPPQFKSRYRHMNIPHRCVSGCSLRQSPRHLRSWEIRLKGVPGIIHARGHLPSDATEWLYADVKFRDNYWEISAALSIKERRLSQDGRPAIVRFDCIDGLATVNGALETPQELLDAQILSQDMDAMLSTFDQRWPRTRSCTDEEKAQRRIERAEIAKLAGLIRRKRANALHVWTKRVIERSSMITIVKFPIQKNTKSPRGSKEQWGANINVVSDINRSTLSYAPAMAIGMLEYKAKECGIRCEIIDDASPMIGVGADLVTAGKLTRRARRELKKVSLHV